MLVIIEPRLGFGIAGLSGFAPVHLGPLNRRGYPRQTSKKFGVVIAALVGTCTESPEPIQVELTEEARVLRALQIKRKYLVLESIVIPNLEGSAIGVPGHNICLSLTFAFFDEYHDFDRKAH